MNDNITQTDEVKEELMEEFFSDLVTTVQDTLSSGEEASVYVNQELIVTFHPFIIPDNAVVN